MMAYITAGAIGSLVGVTELISRYKDQPGALLLVPSAWFYAILNACASVVALYLMRVFDWQSAGSDPASAAVIQIALASLGAMAVLRTSIFNVKIEGNLVPIGPSALLMTFLAAADRGVDRVQSRRRSSYITGIMQGVSFEKARIALPTYCLSLMQNISSAEQQDLRKSVDSLAATDDLTDTQKAASLGVMLMNVVGPATLGVAVDALKGDIKSNPSLTESQ